MLRRYISKKGALASPIPQFDHDPNFIVFRSWSAILSLAGKIPQFPKADPTFLFLDENAEADEVGTLPVGKPVCLRNPGRYAHLNVTIVCARTGNEVFYAKELPTGGFLHLEFAQEGNFTLHFSPAFSQVTLHRSFRVAAPALSNSPIASNFHPSLNPSFPLDRG